MFMVNVGTYSIHGAYGQGEAQNGGKIERFREEGIVFFIFIFTSANIFVEHRWHWVVTFGDVDLGAV